MFLKGNGGRFLNNTIRFSTRSCLLLGIATDTLVQGNRISGCAEHGIVSVNGSRNRYQGNQVSEAGGSCLSLQEFAVIIGKDAKGTGQGNRLAGCAGYGIALSEPSNFPTVRGNTVEGVGGSAIITRSLDALIQGNTLLHAGFFGIEAAGDRTAVIHNRVTAPTATGIIGAGAGFRIAKNTITEAGRRGIDHVGSHPLVRGNTVRNARGDGIAVSGERAPRVLGNTVTTVGIGARSSGITYACTAADTCDGGTRESTQGEIARNTVTGVPGGDGIAAVVHANGLHRGILVRAKRVTDAARHGLNVEMHLGNVGGPTVADGNVVSRAGRAGGFGIRVSGHGNTIRNNIAQQGGGIGLVVLGSANEVLGNQAQSNARGGIWIANENLDPNTLVGNTAIGNRGDGIELDKGQASLERNVSTGNLKGFNCSNDGATVNSGSPPSGSRQQLRRLGPLRPPRLRHRLSPAAHRITARRRLRLVAALRRVNRQLSTWDEPDVMAVAALDREQLQGVQVELVAASGEPEGRPVSS